MFVAESLGQPMGLDRPLVSVVWWSKRPGHAAGGTGSAPGVDEIPTEQIRHERYYTEYVPRVGHGVFRGQTALPRRRWTDIADRPAERRGLGSEFSVDRASSPSSSITSLGRPSCAAPSRAALKVGVNDLIVGADHIGGGTRAPGDHARRSLGVTRACGRRRAIAQVAVSASQSS